MYSSNLQYSGIFLGCFSDLLWSKKIRTAMGCKPWRIATAQHLSGPIIMEIVTVILNH